jgi:pyroglutamyl-peptidase
LLSCTNGETIEIIVPEGPIPAAYYKIFAQTSDLISQHAPDVVVHVGLDVDSGPGVFKVERSAPREGYHDIPDIDRKVFTRTENKKVFGKAPASLVTTLDIDAAAEAWATACSSLALSKASSTSKAKGKGKSESRQPVDVRLSDDVGPYVCGFQYYVSMLEMEKRTKCRDVVFFHVPNLAAAEEVKVGVSVTEELIMALVEARRQ